MPKKLLLAICALIGSVGAARSQVNVGFLDFEGRGFIVNNPLSETCLNAGFVYAEPFTIVYRHTLDPKIVNDALSFTFERFTERIESTQSPGNSLNGPAAAQWEGINARAAQLNAYPSSSNLSIKSGVGGAITMSTSIVVISGTINDLLTAEGCDVEFHGALVRRPN